MITDEQLKALKEKDINELDIQEKFNVIQSVFKATHVDYKSRWWLDSIFDSYLSQMYEVVVLTSKNYCKITIITNGTDFNDNEDIEYESSIKVSTRHDAMLNAVTLYAQKC